MYSFKFPSNLRCTTLHLLAVSQRHCLLPLLNVSKWNDLSCIGLHLLAVSRSHCLLPLLNLSKLNNPDQVSCLVLRFLLLQSAKHFSVSTQAVICFQALIVPRLDSGSQNITYDPVSDSIIVHLNVNYCHRTMMPRLSTEVLRDC